MHIRRSFHLRLFGQSLKRIGTALKDLGEGQPAHIGATSMPAKLRALAQAPDTARDTLTAGQPELRDQLQRTALLTRLAIDLRAALDPATIVHNILAAIKTAVDDEEAARQLIRPHIVRVRRKLELDPQQPSYLLSVRGLGYRWANEPAILQIADCRLQIAN